MDLRTYREELEFELQHILEYWIHYAVDHSGGGFIGRIDGDNHPHPESPKGSVLNARILWAFSAAFNQFGNAAYLETARMAFDYLNQYFIDAQFGGIFWTVDYKGRPLETKKQIYAQAFAVYAYSEYYLASGDRKSIETALELAALIEDHSFDAEKGGYFEAFARDWSPARDLRLSDKDANEQKTLNTHLHILEAYSNLYKMQPAAWIERAIRRLLANFETYFIDSDKGHLRLFFDECWNGRSELISYGHEIEASWLLQEAANLLSDPLLEAGTRQQSLKLVNAAAEGMDRDGGLWYEFNERQQRLVAEKHWWPQAEAMVGFFNAWENTAEEKYLQMSFETWHFVKQHIIDHRNGEWFWGLTKDYSIMRTEDKLGIWKCPYHNSRACLEIIARINKRGR